MVALILNSGLGRRMGVYTSEHPKCMTELTDGDTILSRQLRLLAAEGIDEVVITTGYFNDILMEYCNSLGLPIKYSFVYNPEYDKTNYIYSIYCARGELENRDVLMLHGDLVFEGEVLREVLAYENSCMKVSSTIPLPEKDFKAVVRDGLVKKVGVEFFDEAMEAQAMYKLNKTDWKVWLDRICEFCESDRRGCYAEVALNEVTEDCKIYAYDVKDKLCAEIDTPDDWQIILKKLKENKE